MYYYCSRQLFFFSCLAFNRTLPQFPFGWLSSLNIGLMGRQFSPTSHYSSLEGHIIPFQTPWYSQETVIGPRCPSDACSERLCSSEQQMQPRDKMWTFLSSPKSPFILVHFLSQVLQPLIDSANFPFPPINSLSLSSKRQFLRFTTKSLS